MHTSISIRARSLSGLLRAERSPEGNACSAATKQRCDWSRDVKPRVKVLQFREEEMEHTEAAEHFSKEKQ